MIGRRHHLVIDAPDPRAPADFWSAVLGEPVTYDDGDFVVVAADDRTSGLAFQRAPDDPRPTWPAAGVAQQMHRDVMVDDPAAAARAVLALGGTHLRGPVCADPAGQPFCLIARPSWAAPADP